MHSGDNQNNLSFLQQIIPITAGVAIAACLATYIPLPSLRGPGVIPFLTYFLIAFLAYFIAVLALKRSRPPLWLIWGFAVLFRLLLLASQPTLSDDVYRYIWDGHLLNQGVNPYSLPVSAPSLDSYTIPLRELVNHDWMASPYLPAAQPLFAIVTRIAPQNILAFQVLAALLDLATGWLVMGLLRLLALPPRNVLIYLWNPLVMVEFAHGAHMDAWMIFLVVLAVWFLARGGSGETRRSLLLNLSVLAMAAATLTKAVPVIFIPLFLRRWGWRRLALYAAVVLLLLVLFAAGAGWGLAGPMDGRGVFGALRIYANQWNFNSGIYHWLEVWLSGYKSAGAVPVEPPYEGAIRTAKMITSALMGLCLLLAAYWAWRIDQSPKGFKERTRDLLRLAVLPAGAYLLLTPTLHPWYVIIILPWLPFLHDPDGESLSKRFLWPWLYFSFAVALSYLTYVNPTAFHEYAVVRWLEYLPFYALLLWAAWPYFRKVVMNLRLKQETG